MIYSSSRCIFTRRIFGNGLTWRRIFIKSSMLPLGGVWNGSSFNLLHAPRPRLWHLSEWVMAYRMLVEPISYYISICYIVSMKCEAPTFSCWKNSQEKGNYLKKKKKGPSKSLCHSIEQGISPGPLFSIRGRCIFEKSGHYTLPNIGLCGPVREKGKRQP